ncbi:MAG: Ig-like domain-containing protein [Gemmatimonadota bacterium]
MSPIDSVIAVGSTVRLEAQARAESGAPVSTTVTWSSSHQAVATVSGSGLVSGLSSGQTTVVAAAGGATASYPMRAVDARLAEFSAVLADPFVAAASQALSTSVSAQLTGIVGQCEAALLTAHVLALEACMVAASGLGATDGTDQPLLGVLDLIFAHSHGLLELGR